MRGPKEQILTADPIIQKRMADKVEFIVSTKDESTPQMEKIKGGFSGMQESFARAGAAFTLVGGGIGLVVKQWVDGAAEAERAQKQLKHAVIDVSKGTKEQLAAMEELSTSIQKKGVLDGDAVKIGLAQLSTFGLSTDAVYGLGQSMSDLAVNQFGVNASGEQLTSSANMLAKALRGEFGMLEKSGIRFSEAQQHAIKFGTEMEKVAAINEGFAQNLKYTNEVALKTFEGQMANLSNRFGDFQESLGAAVIPLIQKLSDVLTVAVEWLENMDPNVRDAIAQGIAFAGAFALVAGAISLVIAAINPVTIAVVAAGAAFVLWKLYGQQVLDFFSTFAPLFDAIWASIKGVIDAVWDWINTNITPKVEKFIEDIKVRFAPIVKFFQDHWDEISAVFSVAYEVLAAASEAFWGNMVNIFGVAWDLIVLGFSNFWEAIKLVFTVAWEVFAGLFKVGLSLIQGDWAGAWTAIKEMFMGIFNAMKSFLEGILNNMLTFITGQWDKVKGVFQDLSDVVTKTWSTFWNGLKSIVDTVVGEITKIIDKIVSTVTGAVNAIKDLINLAGKAGSAVAQGIGSGINAVGSAVTGNRAGGGHAVAGQALRVGEDGEEIFLPPSAGTIIPNNQLGGGGQTVVFNFYGTISSKEVAKEYAEIILGDLKLSTQVI